MAPNEILNLSTLAHTWIIDLDGTLLKHNGYKTGEDCWLDGALEFLRALPAEDYILLLTAREESAKEKTIEFLRKSGVRFNKIIFEIPMGERILINDAKPSGLFCAHALNVERNAGLDNIKISIDPEL